MRKFTVTAFKTKAEKMVAAANPGVALDFEWINVLPYADNKGGTGKSRTGFVFVTGEGFRARKMIATAFTDGTFSVR